MRAVFTVLIPPTSINNYPTDEEFLARVRAHGWDERRTKDLSEEEVLVKYKESATKLWIEMPEIANEEKEFLIFYGVLQDSQTKFVITRLIEGQATFRLLHPNLANLEASTEMIIKKLINTAIGEKPLEISNQAIAIYERGFDHVIIRGRVIANVLLESWRVNRKDALLTLAAAFLFILFAIGILFVDQQQHALIGGTLERLSTAMITTALVSALGFAQTYLEIRSFKIIDWSVAGRRQTH